MRIAELRKRLATVGIPMLAAFATVGLMPAVAQAKLSEGHPELYVNGAKAEGESKAIAQLGYGDIELESKQLPGGFVECVNLGFGDGWNSGSGLRAHGKILSWEASGHSPGKTNGKEYKELGAECRGLGGKAWATDEKPLKPVSAKEATRGELTTPWNVEAICGEREEEPTTLIVVGVPTTLTTAQKEAREKRKCVSEETEKEEFTNEVEKKEGCYATNPAPAGCIGVLVVDPEISLELNYGGSLRAKGNSGAGSGLDQSTWVFEGGGSGELQCQSTGCSAKGITFGTVKQQGFESVQLITDK